jgi:hypothetical protein
MNKPTLTPEQRIALQEQARRKGLLKAQGSFLLQEYLFDKQLAFVLDPAPFKVGVTTRRAGKTIACATDLTHTAVSTPDCIVLYITLSRKNAKRLVWPEFKRLNEKFELGGIPNETDLSITYPNGSVLYLLGVTDRSSIEDFRGMPIKKAYLDESQAFPAYIEQLIDDVIGPALMDHDGQLILIGTPGPVPNGYFFDLTKNKAWSQHTWSFFDNPKLPFLSQGLTHKNMLDRELNRRGVSVTDPSIQREWFGRWVLDDNSLVYHYDKAKNDYRELPEGNWTYLLGVDLGFEDADALAVVAYSADHPCTYLLQETVNKRQDLTTLCREIDKLVAKYSISRIVVDTGGLGKKITEEISKRYDIPMVAAEKTRKVEFIELMNDALRTGRFKIKSDSLFAQDAMKVEWDHDKSTPDKKFISRRFHSDICEAVLYVWRESYSYTYKRANEEPEYGTKAWGDAEAEKMLQATVDRLEQVKEEEDAPTLEIDNSTLQKLYRPTLRYQRLFIKRANPFK